MADFYGSKNGESFWPDAKPAPESLIPEPPTNANPTAPVSAAPTQIPPAVQPLVIVPYSSQMQPLYQYTPEAMRAMFGSSVDGRGLLDGLGDPDDEEDFPDVNFDRVRRKPNAMAIVGLILGVIAIAFMVIGYFGFLPAAILPFLQIYNGLTVLGVILTDLVGALTGGAFELTAILAPGLIALSALFTIITLITNIASVVAKKYPIAGKVFAWMAFAFAAAAIIILWFQKTGMQLGASILLVLIWLIAILCTAGRRKE